MAIEDLKRVVDQLLNRVDAVRGRGEEATKQAMVLPIIEALGYDIWNPAEVCPEFEADTAVKKAGQKEKVDLAILQNGEPKIFFEVKSIDQELDGHHGQLKRYFTATTSVSLGILTNGLQYRFFTDTGDLNIQDDEPFFVADFQAVDQGLDVLARFDKSIFSGEAIRDFATELTYTEKIFNFLKREIDIRDNELSESFIRWILASDNMYDGRVTANVIDRFKPITKTALRKVVTGIVRRSVAAIDKGVSEPEEIPVKIDPIEIAQDDTLVVDNELSEDKTRGRSVVTTEEELAAFAILKNLFDESPFSKLTIFDPSAKKDVPIEISYKDTTVYFNVYFNKPSWWCLRLSLESKIKWIGFDLERDQIKDLLPPSYEGLSPISFAKFRVKLNKIEDLKGLELLIHAAFEKAIQSREECRS